ncbi:MAG: tetratricopeptide repeat protein [Verrucomicrobiales bacterium]|nr:tetratricopeptide repeat protein [Verrucomicrobiales bacterium]
MVAGWLLWFFGSTLGFSQTPAERIAFDAALRSFETGLSELAGRQFSEFIAANPSSPLVPQAILLEARARLAVGQLDAAAQGLASRLEALGPLKDEALYLIGDIELRRGRHPEAAQAFGRLTASTQDPGLLLKAAVAEALAWFRANQWRRVSDLLIGTTNAFTRASTARPNDETSVRGLLLLAETQLKLGEIQPARATLTALTNRPLTATQAWEQTWLQTSLLLTNREVDAALMSASNLTASVAAAASRDLLARSRLLQGEAFRIADRPVDALTVLTNNLAESTPIEWRQDAMLAIAALPLLGPQMEPAVQSIASMTAGPPTNLATIAARITLAELRLQQHYGPPPPPTNAVAEARQHLLVVVSNSPSATLTARAWFDLGWCELAEGRQQPATDAFARAAEGLQPSPLHALALFKWADGLQAAGQHSAALTNYLRLLREYPDSPALRGGIRERALYQGAVAATAVGDQGTANRLAGQAVVEFPNGDFRDDTRVLYGQTLARIDPPHRARELLQDLARRLVDSPALPEIQLAVARSYLREGSWSNALTQLEDWTRSYGNHSGIARAEFERAWTTFKAGDDGRAFSLFTNFLARYPADAAAPRAQTWVGDYLLRKGDFVAAEGSYQLVFQRTNWPVTSLTHEARLLAGRAAFLRQGYRDARGYFSWLITNGPPAVTNSLISPELVAQSYLALGDCFLLEKAGDDAQRDRDNKLSDAMNAFVRTFEAFPQTREAHLAKGKLANCHLQIAELDPSASLASYTNAAQLYLELIESPSAGVATRSEAEFGLGLVREKQAGRAEGPDRAEGLKSALQHHLRVFHAGNLRPGELASPFWVNRAGVEAARVAEGLGLADQAAAIYDRLAETFPATADGFRKRAQQLRGR